MTEVRFGHNLMVIQTQHLVSIQGGKEAGNGTRCAFSGRRRAEIFSPEKKASHGTILGTPLGVHGRKRTDEARRHFEYTHGY